jgi:hypothetical protein
MTKTRKRNPFRWLLPDALRDLGRLPGRLDANLLSWRRNAPVLPADVGKYLQEAMFAPGNILEDARYSKVVPNDYVVEVNEQNYQRHYRPIESVVVRQWQDRLVDVLSTQNSRQGRKEYRLEGAVRIQLRPVTDLPETEVRVYCRINPEIGAPPDTVQACLELLHEGKQWVLRPDVTVIGRYQPCDICLDLPVIQQKRLVSGQHAHIRHHNGRFRLFDGTPEGKPSTNGTFVNGRPVHPAGQELHDGDVIVLAALDPVYPDPSTPGVAALHFRANCSGRRA